MIIRVTIGRASGPSNDLCMTGEYGEGELDTIKDVIAAVNAVSLGKEGWYLQINEDNTLIIPSVYDHSTCRWKQQT